MESIDEQLERRRRLMRRMAAAMTPGERLRAMETQQQAFLNAMSPEGYQQFLRRNFRKRADRRPPHAATQSD